MISSISGKTKVCGIIGDPIEHTLSPVMQNAAFKKLGLDYVFLAFRVKKEDLGQAIAGMRALNIRGLNVTMPHKQSVIPMLDKLDPLARAIGAVNTIVNDAGTLTGYNTDAAGFLQALLSRGIKPAGKKVLILGAGGAARAIAFILADNGAELTIVNRNLERAAELARHVGAHTKAKVQTLQWNETSLSGAMPGSEIVVNCTSVGMSPNTGDSPLPSTLLKAGMAVFDIVYNPIMTRLLREAEKAGATTISGVDMLVGQGVLGFEMWTGKKAPVTVMRGKVIKTLESHEK